MLPVLHLPCLSSILLAHPPGFCRVVGGPFPILPAPLSFPSAPHWGWHLQFFSLPSRSRCREGLGCTHQHRDPSGTTWGGGGTKAREATLPWDPPNGGPIPLPWGGHAGSGSDTDPGSAAGQGPSCGRNLPRSRFLGRAAAGPLRHRPFPPTLRGGNRPGAHRPSPLAGGPGTQRQRGARPRLSSKRRQETGASRDQPGTGASGTRCRVPRRPRLHPDTGWR